jgi:hypothetical protein
MAGKYDWWKDNTYETPSMDRTRWEQIRRALIDKKEVDWLDYIDFLKLASYPDLRERGK